MNHTTTRLAFTSPERKLALALALGVGMMGMGGCGKKVAPPTPRPKLNIVSFGSYNLASSTVLAYTFQPKDLKKVLFKLVFVESGVERVIGTWALDSLQETTQIQLAISQQGEKTELACQATHANMASSTAPFILPAGLEYRGSGHSAGGDLPLYLNERNILWQQQYFPKNARPNNSSNVIGNQWKELLDLSQKQKDSQLVLTAEIPPEVAPSAPSAPKN